MKELNLYSEAKAVYWTNLNTKVSNYGYLWSVK